jgi:hypothetical protein
VGQVALHLPAALGGAEPWGAVGAGVAGPGQEILLGAGQAWGAGQQLCCWAETAAGAAHCAKLEKHNSVVMRPECPKALACPFCSTLTLSGWLQ